MHAIKTLAVVVAGAAQALAFSASAAPIAVFNTGVGNNLLPLADGIADPHYKLFAAPAGSGFGTAFAVTPGVPASLSISWAANSGISKWLAPAVDQGCTTTAPVCFTTTGLFDYRLTFDLTGLDPATATLQGVWSSDNEGVIDLNGKATANSIGSTSFVTLSQFTISGGFLSGINILDFMVTNDVCPACLAENPTGLRVEFNQASANPAAAAAPEPASILILGTGLTLLGVRRRRAEC